MTETDSLSSETNSVARETVTVQAHVGKHHDQDVVALPRRVGKSQVVGALIGEVAHEFNNLLMVIFASADLLLAKLPVEDPTRSVILDLLEAGTRAGDLTRKLRALSQTPGLGMIAVGIDDIESDSDIKTSRILGHVDANADWTPSSGQSQAVSKSETILVVTDDSLALESIRGILELHGYAILAARHGIAAIATVFRSAHPIQLLVTETVLPELSAFQLANELAASIPCLPILFMGAPDEQKSILNGNSNRVVAFIRKPFDSVEFLTKVRELLASRTHPKSIDGPCQ